MKPKITNLANFAVLCLGTLLAMGPLPGNAESQAAECRTAPQVCLDSLTDLSVETLRKHRFTSNIIPLQRVEHTSTQHTLMLGYRSEELDLYSRLDLPQSPPPKTGYPLVVLAPGWISKADAPNWDFGLNGKATFSGIIDSLAAQGFAVITAGYRARGTVNGNSAPGMPYRDAWGNGSYISPIFYAIDVLNLLAGLKTLDDIDWQQWLPAQSPIVHFDFNRVSLWGHSQGGDVGITVLAVAGKNPLFPQPLYAASIWAGNIPDRLTQAATFRPMASTTEAFMSGDGSWTGSAIGRNGEINPNFVFAWPADWIGTVDTTSENWTWQAETWSATSVSEVWRSTLEEMYSTLERYIRDVQQVTFTLENDKAGAAVVKHDATVAAKMADLGGYNFAHYIATPLALHISDRDYYSLPEWNHDLARRVNAQGGRARVYVYPGNTHSLQRSEHAWFSPEGTVAGAPIAMQSDRKLFSTGKLVEYVTRRN